MSCTLEESNTERVPILLEEILRKVLSHTQSVDSVQKDIFFILIIVLMLENGFFPVSEEIELKDPMLSIDLEQLSKWKLSTGIFEAKFVMCGFQNMPFKLIVSPLGSTVIVNIVISELNSETYSVCFPVSRYIVSPLASTVPMIFRDLKHLSITFKNKLLMAVKSVILNYHGYASASLIGLPEEQLFKIMMYLPITDIVNVSKTCSRLHSLMTDEYLWHDLFRRDFNVNQSVTNNWKTKYKELYSTQRDKHIREARQARGTLHNLMDHSYYGFYIDNPSWNI